MISIAGVIGAGLFVGSGTAIATAGPAVLLAYAFAGLLVILVMRMLGEMAAATPDSGSFSTYADRAIGRWAVGAVVAAVLVTMFSFMGTEIVTIAAAESENPAEQIGRATRSAIWRISVFYLASILLVVALVPWSAPELPENGSYQTALDAIGIPNAKLIVDIVVLVAVASCLNSALYTCSPPPARSPCSCTWSSPCPSCGCAAGWSGRASRCPCGCGPTPC
ncbi:amino acid permease [Pseudonocardia terrae]|uniref:amino acid permease n=1 Tax=Pseudonocardia terrae TaxID=2905831 RepID=UPI0021030092|nr:amino acid permease [Pseudonocardia terrae]